MLGLSVLDYEVYVNGATNAAGVVSSNQWTMTAANGLAAGSTNTFQVDYVLTTGQRSPISPAATGITWGGLNWGGIPYEWMVQYYGSNTNLWPAAASQPAVGSPTVYQIFLSGGNPNQPATWLKTALTPTAQGLFLSWNTQPGATYQVQVTADLVTWSMWVPPGLRRGRRIQLMSAAVPTAITGWSCCANKMCMRKSIENIFRAAVLLLTLQSAWGFCPVRADRQQGRPVADHQHRLWLE